MTHFKKAFSKERTIESIEGTIAQYENDIRKQHEEQNAASTSFSKGINAGVIKAKREAIITLKILIDNMTEVK